MLTVFNVGIGEHVECFGDSRSTGEACGFECCIDCCFDGLGSQFRASCRKSLLINVDQVFSHEKGVYMPLKTYISLLFKHLAVDVDDHPAADFAGEDVGGGGGDVG